MPIMGVQQPDILLIDEKLRLRKFDKNYEIAFAWYQNIELVYMVDGVKEPYSMEKLKRMYDYLSLQGELYFIESLVDGDYRSIGDVTFWQEDMPIVIGDSSFRGKGVGKKVIRALIQRAKELGYKQQRIADIYEWNKVSKKCFTDLGFVEDGKTEKGSRYRLGL